MMALFEHFPYTNFQDLNLNELLRRMRQLLEEMRDLQNYVGGFDDRIKELETYVDALNSGNFPESFLNSLYSWLDSNVPDIIYRVVKMVWFGLTDSGYFVAYIPEAWQDIQFNTTEYDIFTDLQPEYGHLTLSTKGAYRTWR